MLTCTLPHFKNGVFVSLFTVYTVELAFIYLFIDIVESQRANAAAVRDLSDNQKKSTFFEGKSVLRTIYTLLGSSGSKILHVLSTLTTCK